VIPESEIRRRRVKFPDRGVELELVDYGGRGPLSVLAHATGFCADTLAPIAAVLRAHYRVVSWDARGHGNSEKPAPPEPYLWDEFARDVSAVTKHWLDETGAARVALAVGHSFGGTCTMNAAAREPERYEKLALLDPVIVPAPRDFPGADPMKGGPLMAAQIARKRKHIFVSRDEVRARWREKGTFGDWDARALDAYLAHGFRERADGTVELACPGEVEAAVFESGAKFDAWRDGAALRTPAALFHAAQGNFPHALVERFAALSPSIELRSFAGPHLFPMIKPDEAAAAILDWAEPGAS
jgi:pimeloyl-ACP methyl ester carboxylesterase